MADGELYHSYSSELYNLSFDSVEEDSDHASWFSLIQNLLFHKLELLKVIFREKSNLKFEEIGLTREEFLSAINSLYGNSKYSLQSILLFDDITKGKTSTVTWNVFLDFLILNLNPETNRKVQLAVDKIECVPHTKRETIVKIVLIETEKYFCYAVISKHGRIGIYDGNLNFLTSYHIIMTREDITRSEDERRRKNRWVTDAIFCKDILMFIVTNTARSFVIYEASGLKHVPYWLILSTPNIVECIDYKCYDEETNESMLFMGDCYGETVSFTFLQPTVGLFRRKHNDKISLFYWNELPDEKDYVVMKSHGRTHQNSVKHVKYCSKDEAIFTCSRDANASVAENCVSSKKKTCVFKMTRGTNCFTLSDTLKLLITGSEDGIIRVWNTVIVSTPIAVLLGHKSGIVDVQMMEIQQLLSCSEDAVLKLWDIKEQTCLQTLRIKFPSFGVEGKLIEWGKNCIFAGPKRYEGGRMSIHNNNTKRCFSVEGVTERKGNNHGQPKSAKLKYWERSHILVTCCNHIAIINLTFDNINMQKTLENQVLPPPPLQNSVLIPSSWKVQEKPTQNDDRERTPENYHVEEHMKQINFILEKNIFEDFIESDINYKIAVLETKKLQMQKHVARGAPYVALDFFEIADFNLSENLPIPNKKSTKSIAERTQKMLADAATKDQAFSEPTSSRSKSSRSSVVELPY